MQANSRLLSEKDQSIQRKSIRDKMRGHEENSILSSIYIPLL